jgi:signal transduction histidine kinase
MPAGRPAAPLERTLTLRAVLIAVGVSALVSAFFLFSLIVDRRDLRRDTLQVEANAIVQAQAAGHNPAKWLHYAAFPHAYAFRIYDHRGLTRRQLLAKANEGLLPLPGAAGLHAPPADLDLVEGFHQLAPASGPPTPDAWMLTDYQNVAGHAYWVQTVMVGDPAWLSRRVLEDQMLGHFAVPMLSLAVALTLAIVISTRIALRPLRRVSRQATQLAIAAASGGRLAQIEVGKLPLELHEVIVAINTMLDRLDRTLQLQKQFTADAAHELRTPIAVLLLQVAELPPGPAVASFRGELEGLGGLVGKLLQLAQAENVAHADNCEFDLVALARKVCEELVPAALLRAQVIEFDTPETSVPVLGNAALVETALRNLVDNAIKYSPFGATVTVRVDPAARVVVADEGPGIRDEHKELVFNRFWRADRRRHEGAGIGLALVRRIAQLHGAEVRVEDRPGGGANFVLQFPAMLQNA